MKNKIGEIELDGTIYRIRLNRIDDTETADSRKISASVTVIGDWINSTLSNEDGSTDYQFVVVLDKSGTLKSRDSRELLFGKDPTRRCFGNPNLKDAIELYVEKSWDDYCFEKENSSPDFSGSK